MSRSQAAVVPGRLYAICDFWPNDDWLRRSITFRASVRVGITSRPAVDEGDNYWFTATAEPNGWLQLAEDSQVGESVRFLFGKLDWHRCPSGIGSRFSYEARVSTVLGTVIAQRPSLPQDAALLLTSEYASRPIGALLRHDFLIVDG